MFEAHIYLFQLVKDAFVLFIFASRVKKLNTLGFRLSLRSDEEFQYVSLKRKQTNSAQILAFPYGFIVAAAVAKATGPLSVFLRVATTNSAETYSLI